MAGASGWSRYLTGSMPAQDGSQAASVRLYPPGPQAVTPPSAREMRAHRPDDQCCARSRQPQRTRNGKRGRFPRLAIMNNHAACVGQTGVDGSWFAARCARLIRAFCSAAGLKGQPSDRPDGVICVQHHMTPRRKASSCLVGSRLFVSRLPGAGYRRCATPGRLISGGVVPGGADAGSRD